jgi:hypothetical protein
MSRQELVAAAAVAGIKNASRTKSIELVEQLENMKVTQTTKVAKTTGRGRPIVEGSARQVRLAARMERANANGGVVKRGRPAGTKKEAEA